MSDSGSLRTLSRRRFNGLAAASAGALALGGALAMPAAPGRAAPVGPDGLHIQPWFLQSFLILKEDLAEADNAGKRLAVIWELEGCPYCREMHAVNFMRPEIVDYIKANFSVVQLNFIGARTVTDFDGEELPEKKLAEKWGVRFTPTIQFFPRGRDLKAGTPGHKAEVARMPGYLKPFHFLSMFQYVKEEAYAREKFGAYMKGRLTKLKKSGKTPESW